MDWTSFWIGVGIAVAACLAVLAWSAYTVCKWLSWTRVTPEEEARDGE